MNQPRICLAREYAPDTLLIEQTGPGLHLVQELRANPETHVPVPIGIKPEGDKHVRMEAQSPRFEAGQVFLPKDAPWLSTFLHEILGFPNTRYDDQVDSVSQLLSWAETHETSQKVYCGCYLVYPDGSTCPPWPSE